MKVRAKFKVDSIESYVGGKQAKLSAVCSNSGENKDFCEATPNGNLSIWINEDYPASQFFKVGKDYYLDFTEAE